MPVKNIANINREMRLIPKEDQTMTDTTDTLRCPRCGTHRLHPAATRNAISRKDNRTHVCSACGTDEGLRDFAGQDVWPGYPGPLTEGD